MPDGGAGWNERTESMTPSRDAEGHLRAMRVYRVWGYARTAILGDPTQILSGTTPNQGLPGYGSPWEGMWLDRYDVAAVGNIFDVTALYSSDDRFKFPNAPAKLNGSWSWRQTTVEVDIPFAEMRTSRELVRTSSTGEIQYLTVNAWVFDAQKIEHPFLRVGYQVYLNRDEAYQAMEALRAIGNTLQKIRSVYWLAEPGTATEEDDGRWHVEYGFLLDPGTKPIPITWNGPGAPERRYPPGVFRWPPGQNDIVYSRPPFHTSILAPGSPTNPTADPVWGAARKYDMSNPVGWAALPKFNP